MTEKKSNKVKVNDFLTRTKELESNKKTRLDKIANKVREDEDKIYTGQPITNNKLEYIRSVEEYYNDQIQALENRQIKLEEILQKDISILREKPEITEVSIIFIIQRNRSS